MEASGVVFRPNPIFSGAPGRESGRSRVSINPRTLYSENAHMQYYMSVRCGGGKKKDRQEVMAKKKLKLVKGLSKDHLLFSEIGGDGLLDQKHNVFSEETDMLLAQLKQLKAERKDMKRKRKQEKAKLKAARTQSMKDDDSPSSSSSESSDSECEQVVNMRHMRRTALLESKSDVQPTTVEGEAALPTSPCNTNCNQRKSGVAEPELDKINLEIQALLHSQNPLSGHVIEDDSLRSSGKESCSPSDAHGNGDSLITRAIEGRIDVCMGGKCKKLGAAALKDELDRRVGNEGVVIGCKCMGKCKSAPNVRVSANVVEGGDTSARVASNPLYIGVGLEDVDAIATYFLGEERKNVNLVAA